MTITANQKTDITNAYIAAIKARTATRVEAQKRNNEALKATKENTVALNRKAAEKLVKKHKLPEITSVETGRAYASNVGHYSYLRVNCGPVSLQVHASVVPEMATAALEQEKQEKLQKDLCHEIEFLSDLMSNGSLAAWGVYVSRRLNLGKDEKATETQLRPLMEDFIQSRRPMTCTLG